MNELELERIRQCSIITRDCAAHILDAARELDKLSEEMIRLVELSKNTYQWK